MKSVFTLSVLLFSGITYAASLTCGQLKKAYDADEMSETKYECRGNRTCEARQLAQLRKTVAHYTEEDPSDKSLKELNAEYQTIYHTVNVGKTKLESVNIDLGDNPFILYFEAGTTKYTGIASVDGTLEVDGKYCEDVAFEPAINSSRKHALCRAVVPAIREEVPKTTFNHTACVDSADFYLNKYTASHVWVQVQRNLREFDAGYFSCKARVNRETNKVVSGSLTCDIH